MQDLKPIRVFLEVADRLSFAAAARSLRMTPASVTRIVARLEEDLGQQLFVRTTRQVSLTTGGALAVARYRPLVADFDRATEEITRDTQPDRGHLSINAPMSFGLRLMPGLIASFRLAYPNITLDVKLTDQFVDILEDSCDLAIRISGPPGDKSTIWRKICEVPRHVFAAPSLFERLARPTTPDDLPRAYCLSYSATGAQATWRFTNGAHSPNVRADSEIVSNNGDFLYALAAGGNGIVVLPGFIAGDGVADNAIEVLLDDWSLPPLWLTLFYPPYEVLPPLVATFSEFFEAYLQDTNITGLGRAAG